MSDLAVALAVRIRDYLLLEQPPSGTRLTERHLAGLFLVSRSPIREALRLLEKEGIVAHTAGQGFFTLGDSNNLSDGMSFKTDPDSELYLKLAEDHLHSKIPERTSEKFLIRRYNTTHGQIKRVLLRASQEGWAQRLPGHGWDFLPVLRSLGAYEQSYRFRILVEPAGILEPSFKLNKAALMQVRDQQEKLLATGTSELSASILYQAGVRVHETILDCSQNAFFIEGLRRANQLRRLLAYQRLTPSWVKNSHSHIEIIDLLLNGDRNKAAVTMKHHLEVSLEGSVTTVKQVSAAIGL